MLTLASKIATLLNAPDEILRERTQLKCLAWVLRDAKGSILTKAGVKPVPKIPCHVRHNGLQLVVTLTCNTCTESRNRKSVALRRHTGRGSTGRRAS